MALLGGGVGGAGNPVGGSFTGPAEALEIIGDHCYAISGEVQDAASGGANSTLFKFTSGNFYAVCNIDFANNVSVNNQTFLALNFNGVDVMTFDNDLEGSFQDQPVKLDVIIPPYTEVTFKWGCNTTKEGCAFLTGKIYRTRD
jgi:hypothetical protein